MDTTYDESRGFSGMPRAVAFHELGARGVSQIVGHSALGDGSGESVALSADASNVAIGTPGL